MTVSRLNVTDIYRIETMNSVYEIKVIAHNGDVYSSCKKMGPGNHSRQVQANGLAYLEKLTIGASFLIPGVVTTSVVQDYQHFVLSTEPKVTLKDRYASGISGFFEGLTDQIARQVRGEAVMVEPAKEVVYVPGVAPGQTYSPGCSEGNHVGSCKCPPGPPTCSKPGCTYGSKYGPSHDGSRMCKSGSIASGGTRSHCSCDYCY